MNALLPTVRVVGGGAAKVDARLAFLHRAHARLMLFEAGAMDLAEAFDGPVSSLSCTCTRAMVEQWERDYPHRCEVPQRHRPTPQSTIDAVLHCIHQHGLTALDEPKNIERLSHFTTDAKAQLNRRIEKLISEKGN
jgi:hypothetical protein